MTQAPQNAFNTIDRGHCLRELYKTPSLSPLFGLTDMLYSTPSRVMYRLGDGSLRAVHSQQGVRQGCPLGPLLFCLGVHPVWSSTPDPPNRVHAAADLDDLAVVSPRQFVFQTFDKIRAGLAKVGLSMAPGKVVLVCRNPSSLPEAFQKEAKDRDIAITDSTILLGALVGASARRTSRWAVTKTAALAPKLNLLTHQGLPRKLALQMAQEVCRSHLTYLSRVLPLSAGLKAAKTLKVMVSNLLSRLGTPTPAFSSFGAAACFSLPDPVSSVPFLAWAGFCSSAQFYEWEGEPGRAVLSLPSVQSANATLQALSAEFERVGATRPEQLPGEALKAFKAQPPNHVSRSLRSPLKRALTSTLVAGFSLSERARFHSQSPAEAKL